jgi:hypothetical protein
MRSHFDTIGMQTNLLWTGREYYSLENCLVNINRDGVEINSVIVGAYQNIIYRVEYKIKATKLWETTFVEIFGQYNNKHHRFKFEGDGKGHWTVNGKAEKKFNGCIDVDIPLTPFTNTLPINRLRLSSREEKQIKVIYCDLLQEEFTAGNQKYIKLSDSIYHYENVPNDFEADIEVDGHGFVVDYPQLFVRKAAMETNYPEGHE